MSRALLSLGAALFVVFAAIAAAQALPTAGAAVKTALAPELAVPSCELTPAHARPWRHCHRICRRSWRGYRGHCWWTCHKD